MNESIENGVPRARKGTPRPRVASPEILGNVFSLFSDRKESRTRLGVQVSLVEDLQKQDVRFFTTLLSLYQTRPVVLNLFFDTPSPLKSVVSSGIP